MAWLKNPPKEKIEIVHIDDWDFICIDGKNVHWHDSLPASELLSRLGFNVENYYPESLGFENDGDIPADNMPDSIAELRKIGASLKRKRINEEIAAKKKELEELESQAD